MEIRTLLLTGIATNFFISLVFCYSVGSIHEPNDAFPKHTGSSDGSLEKYKRSFERQDLKKLMEKYKKPEPVIQLRSTGIKDINKAIEESRRRRNMPLVKIIAKSPDVKLNYTLDDFNWSSKRFNSQESSSDETLDAVSSNDEAPLKDSLMSRHNPDPSSDLSNTTTKNLSSFASRDEYSQNDAENKTDVALQSQHLPSKFMAGEVMKLPKSSDVRIQDSADVISREPVSTAIDKPHILLEDIKYDLISSNKSFNRIKNDTETLNLSKEPKVEERISKSSTKYVKNSSDTPLKTFDRSNSLAFLSDSAEEKGITEKTEQSLPSILGSEVKKSPEVPNDTQHKYSEVYAKDKSKVEDIDMLLDNLFYKNGLNFTNYQQEAVLENNSKNYTKSIEFEKPSLVPINNHTDISMLAKTVLTDLDTVSVFPTVLANKTESNTKGVIINSSISTDNEENTDKNNIMRSFNNSELTVNENSTAVLRNNLNKDVDLNKTDYNGGKVEIFVKGNALKDRSSLKLNSGDTVQIEKKRLNHDDLINNHNGPNSYLTNHTTAAVMEFPSHNTNTNHTTVPDLQKKVRDTTQENVIVVSSPHGVLKQLINSKDTNSANAELSTQNVINFLPLSASSRSLSNNQTNAPSYTKSVVIPRNGLDLTHQKPSHPENLRPGYTAVQVDPISIFSVPQGNILYTSFQGRLYLLVPIEQDAGTVFYNTNQPYFSDEESLQQKDLNGVKYFQNLNDKETTQSGLNEGFEGNINTQGPITDESLEDNDPKWLNKFENPSLSLMYDTRAEQPSSATENIYGSPLYIDNTNLFNTGYFNTRGQNQLENQQYLNQGLKINEPTDHDYRGVEFREANEMQPSNIYKIYQQNQPERLGLFDPYPLQNDEFSLTRQLYSVLPPDQNDLNTLLSNREGSIYYPKPLNSLNLESNIMSSQMGQVAKEKPDRTYFKGQISNGQQQIPYINRVVYPVTTRKKDNIGEYFKYALKDPNIDQSVHRGNDEPNTEDFMDHQVIHNPHSPGYQYNQVMRAQQTVKTGVDLVSPKLGSSQFYGNVPHMDHTGILTTLNSLEGDIRSRHLPLVTEYKEEPIFYNEGNPPFERLIQNQVKLLEPGLLPENQLGSVYSKAVQTPTISISYQPQANSQFSWSRAAKHPQFSKLDASLGDRRQQHMHNQNIPVIKGTLDPRQKNSNKMVLSEILSSLSEQKRDMNPIFQKSEEAMQDVKRPSLFGNGVDPASESNLKEQIRYPLLPDKLHYGSNVQRSGELGPNYNGVEQLLLKTEPDSLNFLNKENVYVPLKDLYKLDPNPVIGGGLSRKEEEVSRSQYQELEPSGEKRKPVPFPYPLQKDVPSLFGVDGEIKRNQVVTNSFEPNYFDSNLQTDSGLSIKEVSSPQYQVVKSPDGKRKTVYVKFPIITGKYSLAAGDNGNERNQVIPNKLEPEYVSKQNHLNPNLLVDKQIEDNRASSSLYEEIPQVLVRQNQSPIYPNGDNSQRATRLTGLGETEKDTPFLVAPESDQTNRNQNEGITYSMFDTKDLRSLNLRSIDWTKMKKLEKKLPGKRPSLDRTNDQLNLQQTSSGTEGTKLQFDGRLGEQASSDYILQALAPSSNEDISKPAGSMLKSSNINTKVITPNALINKQLLLNQAKYAQERNQIQNYNRLPFSYNVPSNQRIISEMSNIEPSNESRFIPSDLFNTEDKGEGNKLYQQSDTAQNQNLYPAYINNGEPILLPDSNFKIRNFQSSPIPISQPIKNVYSHYLSSINNPLLSSPSYAFEQDSITNDQNSYEKHYLENLRKVNPTFFSNAEFVLPNHNHNTRHYQRMAIHQPVHEESDHTNPNMIHIPIPNHYGSEMFEEDGRQRHSRDDSHLARLPRISVEDPRLFSIPSSPNYNMDKIKFLTSPNECHQLVHQSVPFYSSVFINPRLGNRNSEVKYDAIYLEPNHPKEVSSKTSSYLSMNPSFSTGVQTVGNNANYLNYIDPNYFEGNTADGRFENLESSRLYSKSNSQNLPVDRPNAEHVFSRFKNNDFSPPQYEDYSSNSMNSVQLQEPVNPQTNQISTLDVNGLHPNNTVVSQNFIHSTVDPNHGSRTNPQSTFVGEEQRLNKFPSSSHSFTSVQNDNDKYNAINSVVDNKIENLTSQSTSLHSYPHISNSMVRITNEPIQSNNMNTNNAGNENRKPQENPTLKSIFSVPDLSPKVHDPLFHLNEMIPSYNNKVSNKNAPFGFLNEFNTISSGQDKLNSYYSSLSDIFKKRMEKLEDMSKNLMTPIDQVIQPKVHNRLISRSGNFTDVKNGEVNGTALVGTRNGDFNLSNNSTNNDTTDSASKSFLLADISSPKRGCDVNGTKMVVGDEWTLKGVCGVYVCISDGVQQVEKLCPKLSREDENCEVDEGNFQLEFPYCCPTLKCTTAPNTKLQDNETAVTTS